MAQTDPRSDANTNLMREKRNVNDEFHHFFGAASTGDIDNLNAVVSEDRVNIKAIADNLKKYQSNEKLLEDAVQKYDHSISELYSNQKEISEKINSFTSQNNSFSSTMIEYVENENSRLFYRHRFG